MLKSSTVITWTGNCQDPHMFECHTSPLRVKRIWIPTWKELHKKTQFFPCLRRRVKKDFWQSQGSSNSLLSCCFINMEQFVKISDTPKKGLVVNLFHSVTVLLRGCYSFSTRAEPDAPCSYTYYPCLLNCASLSEICLFCSLESFTRGSHGIRTGPQCFSEVLWKHFSSVYTNLETQGNFTF